jgi:hypothetical protein
VCRTGRWLAALHGADVDELPGVDVDAIRRQLLRFEGGLRTAMGADWARMRRCIEALAAAWPLSAEVVVTHGDFQPKNIFVDDAHVTVIDFDRCALAPPARDLGHFLVQSMTMSFVRCGTFDRITGWNDAFLEGYLGRPGPPSVDGLALAITYSLIEIMYYRLFVKPVRDPSFVPAWLDECERQLETAAAW